MAIIHITISTTVSVVTTIPYSDALSNPSSADYATASQNIKDIFQPNLEKVASNNGMELDSLVVSFTDSATRRRKRSTSANADIIAVYSQTISETADLAAVEFTVTDAVTTGMAESLVSLEFWNYIHRNIWQFQGKFNNK